MPVTDSARPTISPIRVRVSEDGEVGAHAGAEVLGGPDVEDARPVVAEEVDAGGVGQPLGEVALAALGGADPGRERLELLEGVDAEAAEPLHQAVQDVHRGSGVRERSVVGRRGRVEHLGQRRQLAVGGVVAGDHAPRELGRVEHLELRPRASLLTREVLEEPDVERCVVRDEDAPGREVQERGQRRLDRWGVADHGVADAGEHRDERRDLRVRVDQRLELTEHLAAPDLHRADLGDHRPGRSGTARRLEVDHAEGQVSQRPPQLVEAALRLPAGPLPRRTVGGGAHVRRR